MHEKYFVTNKRGKECLRLIVGVPNMIVRREGTEHRFCFKYKGWKLWNVITLNDLHLYCNGVVYIHNL